MENYDFIIIGAGMGGLVRHNKKVLVLEKHDKPRGLVTSIARKGVHFDLGIRGLHELKTWTDNTAISGILGCAADRNNPLHGRHDLLYRTVKSRCFITGV